MKALRLTGSVEAPELVEVEMPEPHPGAEEVVVRVSAAGVTPTELRWYPTSHTKTGDTRTGAVPGHEFSGVIAALGSDVDEFTPGQEVFGMNDWFADGATAEYCVTHVASIAPKPSRLTHIEAASVPISALTAWQGLFNRARLHAGERVLVQGAAGSVGVFGVQLATWCGAYVIATASAKNADFVKQLGAQQVIDYTTERFEERVHDVDIVFDSVGGDVLERSWRVLKPNGRMVTIAADGESTGDERVKQAFFIVEPDRKQLQEVAALLDAGKLRPVVDAVATLADAPLAYAGKLTNRRGREKIVIAVGGKG